IDCEKKKPAFDHLRGVVTYDSLVAHTIKSFKYHRDITLTRALARVLYKVQDFGIIWRNYDVILPVPLHPARLRERRFNQALLLLWEMPLARLPLQVDWLRRVRETEPQANLPADQRHENVKGAFATADGLSLTGMRVLVVDDVASTGATLHECSKACKKAGAAVVDAAVVARATLC
ncbi:MAG: ComF family protein, partial [Alphaproteobacteria bacterium]